MKYLLSTFLLFGFIVNPIQAQYTFPYTDFLNSNYEIGATYGLFGDQVKLRSEPNTNGKVLDIYPIGTTVKVLEKAAETYQLYGVNSNWYKVEINSQTGYLVGAFLAAQTLEYNGTTAYINYEVAPESAPYEPLSIVIRMPTQTGFQAYKYKMPNVNYAGATLADNRGFSEIDQILSLEFFAESCGATGGEMHFLVKDGVVIKELSTFYVSDAGVFFYEENAIFPQDPGGRPEVIIYTKTTEEVTNEYMSTFSITGEKSYLEWRDGAIAPVQY